MDGSPKNASNQDTSVQHTIPSQQNQSAKAEAVRQPLVPNPPQPSSNPENMKQRVIVPESNLQETPKVGPPGQQMRLNPPAGDNSHYVLLHAEEASRVHQQIHEHLASMPSEIPRETYVLTSDK